MSGTEKDVRDKIQSWLMAEGWTLPSRPILTWLG